jgi:DNA polymerase I
MPSSSKWIDGRIVDRYYTVERNLKLKLHWVLRTVHGKVKVTTPAPFAPYCIIPAKYLIQAEEMVTKLGLTTATPKRLVGFQLADSEDAGYKIEFMLPEHVGRFRRAMESSGYPEIYQADIPYMELVMIHNDITTKIRIHEDSTIEKPPEDADIPPYVIWYWDIETSDEGEGTEPNPKNDRILAIASVLGGTGHEEEILALDDEKVMLETFYKRIAKDVDILVGYNSDKFDEPYFRKRIQTVCGLSPGFRGVKFLDLGPLVINAEETSLPSWSLDYIAETKLGERKLPILNGFYKTFREDRETLKERCLDDARKLKKLEDAYQYVTFALVNAELSGAPIEKVQYVSHVGDGMTLRESYHRCTPKLIWRCKNHAVKGEKFQGAIVKTPPLGIHAKVACLDFSALYTRIIRENWISQSAVVVEPNANSIDCGTDPVTGARIYFDLSRPAPIAQILERVELERREYLRLMLKAIKEAIINRYDMLQKQRKITGNAMYGFSGDARTRYYYRPIADTITRIAREYLTAVMGFVQSLGMEVIYADTDGIYIKFHEECTYEHMVSTCNNLIPLVNSLCNKMASKRGVPFARRCIDLKFESIYDPVIFFRSEKGQVAKKRYAAREIWSYKREGFLEEPKISIMGLEERRGDRAALTKQMQNHIIRLLIKGYIGKAIRYIRDTRGSLLRGDLDHLTVLSSSLTKPDNEYKTKPPHFRAAQKAKAQGERLMWGKIQYVYVENSKRGLVVEPVVREVIPPIRQSGREAFWEKRILKWCKRIMGAVMNEHEFERKLSGTARLDVWFTKGGNKENGIDVESSV